MTTSSERVDSSPALRNELRLLLKTLQNADGGWGFHAGEPSRVEPTTWAIRALAESCSNAAASNPSSSQEIRNAAKYLQAAQLPDGSWPACAEMNVGSWITSLACSVLAAEPSSERYLAAGLKWLCEDFPRDSSLFGRLLNKVRGDSRTEQNDSYRGWGWTPRTASWVEPTAFALLALRDAPARLLPKNAAERRDLAIALLYDRMCSGGGWNCGNPRVYGVDGDALVLPTCWALLALGSVRAAHAEDSSARAANGKDTTEKPGRTLSLAWLQKAFANIESAPSLAVACMTLENYGIELPPAKRGLHDWTAPDLAGQGTHVLAWVCLALDPERRCAPRAPVAKNIAAGKVQ